jgi:hypothetical protein
LKNSKITQKDGVRYFDHAQFWEKEGIDIVYLEGAPSEMDHEQGKWLKEYRNEGQEFLRLNGFFKKR